MSFGGGALACGLLGRELAFDGPILPPTPIPSGPIVDMHAHTAGLGVHGSGNFVSQALRDSYKFTSYLDAFGVTRDDLERTGDSIVVDRMAALVLESQHVDAAIVLALDGALDRDGELDRDRTEVYVDNDFVARAVAPHPNLHFGASIHPGRRDALDRLDRAIEAGARLIKWIAPIQGFDPADPQFRAFYRRLAAAHVPLLTHGGQERSFTHADDDLGDPNRLRLALDEGVTVIIAHAAAHGGDDNGRFFPRVIELATRYPRLHVDISALTLVHRFGQLADVLSAPELRDRLLYGSDHPLQALWLTSAWHHPLRLTWSQIRAIAAHDNPWDHGVELFAALGVPADAFTRPARLFGLASADAARPSPTPAS